MGKGGLVGEAAFRPDGAVAHGGEGAFDGVRRPQVLPVFGGEIVERQERMVDSIVKCNGLKQI